MSDAPGAPDNEAIVRVVNGPLVAPVLSRMVAMLAARAHCPVDRLDDALLIADAVAAHSQAHARAGHVTVHLRSLAGGLELEVTELAEGGAAGLVADATLPGVGNLLERIADQVELGQNGDGGECVRLRLAFTAAAP